MSQNESSTTKAQPKEHVAAELLRLDLEQVLANIPNTTGVYIFKDKRGRVIYVGKAANLRQRVRSYFRQSGDERHFIERLRQTVASIETTLSGSERDALVLEDALIKQHQPQFNVKLRDDKSFLFLRLRRDDPFPYVEIVRRPTQDTNPTFGPFPSAKAARRTANILHKVFPLRTCSNIKFSHRTRPCLDHQIGRCPAPCVGLISGEAYGAIVDGAEKFLSGDRKNAHDLLKKQMDQAAEELRFEDAARFRDQLAALEATSEEPLVYQFGSDSSDFWGHYSNNVLMGEGDTTPMSFAAVTVLRATAGRVIHSDIFTGVRIESADDLASVLLQYYSDSRSIPASIYVGLEPANLGDLEAILSERRGKKVKIRQPQRGDAAKLLQLAHQNATLAAKTRKTIAYEQVAAHLEKTLHLPRPPYDIECFDVSVHQGENPVGVRVAFSLGQENPDARRRYRLEAGPDRGDVQWMLEMLDRRLRRGIEEGSFPDLIVLDGGMAQLQAIHKLCQQLEIEWQRLPVVALAKARPDDGLEHSVNRTLERVYLPGRRNPILLKPGTPSYDLLVSLRDATHNAAIGYHRNRSRNHLLAGLERVAGMGPERRRRLLEAYPDPSAILLETVETVRQATGIPIRVIKALQAELSS